MTPAVQSSAEKGYTKTMENIIDPDALFDCALAIFPGEIRADEDYMAKYDIDRWLETGRTDHFAVPAIVTVQR